MESPGCAPVDGKGALEAVVRVRTPHWVQAIAHSSIFIYWGAYVDRVYPLLWLIGSQVVFAYVFDMLMAWSRGRKWVIGFGPIPIVGSTNLFLWFKDDLFYLQFAMIALCFLSLPRTAHVSAGLRLLPIVIALTATWIPVGQISASLLTPLALGTLGWQLLWWIGIGMSLVLLAWTIGYRRIAPRPVTSPSGAVVSARHAEDVSPLTRGSSCAISSSSSPTDGARISTATNWNARSVLRCKNGPWIPNAWTR